VLLQDIVASLWSEVLLSLKDEPLAVSEYYGLWPNDAALDTTFALVVDPAIAMLAEHDVLQIRQRGTRLWPQRTPHEFPAPDKVLWASTQHAFFDEFATVPMISSGQDRVQWMSMVLVS
jgi:hypothetical protein